MSMPSTTFSCDIELKSFIERAFLDTEGAVLCQVEQPIQGIYVQTGALGCKKCGGMSSSQDSFIHHLIQCHEGPRALSLFKRYGLYSKKLQKLHADAQSAQKKNIFVPIKGLPSHILRVPFASSLARLLAAGALLRTKESGPLSSPLNIINTNSVKPCPLYLDYSSLYRHSLLLSKLNALPS